MIMMMHFIEFSPLCRSLVHWSLQRAPSAFQQQDFDVIIIGYAIMRLGLVTQWFRVARSDTARRKTALRYAFGIILVQIGWLFFHFSPIHFSVYLFVLLAIAELCTDFC